MKRTRESFIEYCAMSNIPASVCTIDQTTGRFHLDSLRLFEAQWLTGKDISGWVVPKEFGNEQPPFTRIRDFYPAWENTFLVAGGNVHQVLPVSDEVGQRLHMHKVEGIPSLMWYMKNVNILGVWPTVATGSVYRVIIAADTWEAQKVFAAQVLE